MKLITPLVLAVICGTTFHAVAEQSEDISFEQLPQSVQQSVLKHVQKSSISRIEHIGGQYTKYEIETRQKGESRDFEFAADGTVLEIEQTIPVRKIPISAFETIQKRYPNITLDEIEAVQVFYTTIEGTVNGKKVVLKVFANGEIETAED